MDFFKDIVKAKKNIANTVPMDKSLQIAFAIDSAFTFGMGVLMTSIIKNNPDETIAFHIFTDRLTSTDISRLGKLGQRYKNIAVYIYYIDASGFQTMPTSFIWSRAIYYRFIICRELAGKIDKCLYLDSDILCLQPLRKLFDLDLHDRIAATVADSPTMLIYAKKNFNFKGKAYFNSGMLLMNIAVWNKEAVSEHAVAMLLHENYFKFHDQDILNILLVNKIILLPKCYNTIYHLADMHESLSGDTVFLHYSGSVKPWQRWGRFHHLTALWEKYRQLSPWASTPIQEPKTYKEAKFMARTMHRTGKTVDWLKWTLYYGLWKLRDKYLSKGI